MKNGTIEVLLPTAAALAVVGCLIGGCGTWTDEFSVTEGSGVVAEAAERETADDAGGLSEADGSVTGSDPEAADTSGHGDPASDPTESKTVVVDICGAVAHPGVYELPEGSRLYEAVDAAGGLLAEADRKRLNQAEVLTDGQHIIVYAVGEESGEGVSGDAGGEAASVNINTAGVDELTSLTGIGSERAQAIIEDRQKNGAFKAPEDIMRVSGIGEGIFDRIKEDITV